jgi:hypothetical protein
MTFQSLDLDPILKKPKNCKKTPEEMACGKAATMKKTDYLFIVFFISYVMVKHSFCEIIFVLLSKYLTTHLKTGFYCLFKLYKNFFDCKA